MRGVCGGRSYWEPGVLLSKFDTDSINGSLRQSVVMVYAIV